MIDTFAGKNIPVSGFIAAAQERGWQLVPSVWAGATPSSYVTEDAFERIWADMKEDLCRAMAQGLDAVYLDLHGAAVAQNADDAEGELLARIRGVVGENVPIVASLDLHANVTERMLQVADALVKTETPSDQDATNQPEKVGALWNLLLDLKMFDNCLAGRMRPLPLLRSFADSGPQCRLQRRMQRRCNISSTLSRDAM